MELKEPKTRQDLDKYYYLRWRALRQPWNQPKGSEKDELDEKAVHVMACEGGYIVGVGRLHMNNPQEARIEHVAAEDGLMEKGAGAGLMEWLEKRASDMGAAEIVLIANEDSLKFYESRGYVKRCGAEPLFGMNRFIMAKPLHKISQKRKQAGN